MRKRGDYMAMTQFEKALISELQGIRKELHELNNKRPTQGEIDGKNIEIDMGALINNSLRSGERATFHR